jgi:hypothetical protein
MNDLYHAPNLNECRKAEHQFKATWSDKTPMKVSLLCVTCTEETGKSSFVAYGIEEKSFGQWRRLKKKDLEV